MRRDRRAGAGSAFWHVRGASGTCRPGPVASAAWGRRGGSRSWRLRPRPLGCAEKLDEILAAATEPTLRPDIADADSRAATVKQRPTSRRITPAEISVSRGGAGRGGAERGRLVGRGRGVGAGRGGTWRLCAFRLGVRHLCPTVQGWL